MRIQFPIKYLDQFDAFAFYDNAFTDEECEKIKTFFTDLTVASINNDDTVDATIRKSKIKFINPDQGNSWIFEKIYQYSSQCNDVRWKFQLSGFFEGVQLTQYDKDADHYDWHIDSGNKELSVRKLSVIILLDEPENYEGGELSFIGKKEKVKMKKGTLIVFPSYIAHKVHPVTGGIRRTAVAWLSGEPYR